jgi:hypothetical protein
VRVCIGLFAKLLEECKVGREWECGEVDGQWEGEGGMMMGMGAVIGTRKLLEIQWKAVTKTLYCTYKITKHSIKN